MARSARRCTSTQDLFENRWITCELTDQALIDAERRAYERAPRCELLTVQKALGLAPWMNNAQERARRIAIDALLDDRRTVRDGGWAPREPPRIRVLSGNRAAFPRRPARNS